MADICDQNMIQTVDNDYIGIIVGLTLMWEVPKIGVPPWPWKPPCNSHRWGMLAIYELSSGHSFHTYVYVVYTMECTVYEIIYILYTYIYTFIYI